MASKNLPALKTVFNEWAQKHPAPDTPAYGTGARMLTPNEFNREIQSETPYGKQLVDMVEHVAAGQDLTLAKLDKVMAKFKGCG